MEDFASRQIIELSGGQFQRILIARTFAQDADLIFLDEPFRGLILRVKALLWINYLNCVIRVKRY